MADRWVRLWRFCERPEAFHLTLFLWLLAGKVWIFANGGNPVQGLSPVVRTAWTVLGFLCPAMVFVGYGLITWSRGRRRYAGFWLRLGGDAGQFVILPVFIVAFLLHPMGFSDAMHVFAASLMVPVLFFLAVMTLRDVLLLVKMEHLSNEIVQGRK